MHKTRVSKKSYPLPLTPATPPKKKKIGRSAIANAAPKKQEGKDVSDKDMAKLMAGMKRPRGA